MVIKKGVRYAGSVEQRVLWVIVASLNMRCSIGSQWRYLTIPDEYPLYPKSFDVYNVQYFFGSSLTTLFGCETGGFSKKSASEN